LGSAWLGRSPAPLPKIAALLSIRRFSVRWQEVVGRLAFIIELTRGQNWHDPAEIIDRLDCATNSLEAAAAEAGAWLVKHQKHTPERGATHYRVVAGQDTVVGGPSQEIEQDSRPDRRSA
jgi:hypothetical protein